MTHHVPLLTGLLIGFSIAMPIGPMSLLCIQRVLRSGMKAGISTGLGAATINIAYGTAILLGLDKLTPWVTGSGLPSATSGMFLLCSAARIMMRRQTETVAPEYAVSSPFLAYASALMFNATNPMAIVLVLAMLSPVIGDRALTWDGKAVLLTGMFVAAMTWWISLSAVVALFRTYLSPVILVYVNRASGLLLTVYGVLALIRS